MSAQGSSSFKKATRHQLRLRMAIDGPSGAGKSITALRMACGLSPSKKIAVIDTESGSASKYIGQDFGEGPIEFDVLELKTFSPSNYTSAIIEAGRLGYEVIVVDSLSHAWEGKDGALELVNKKGGNSFTAWKDVTPMHQAMIQAIINVPAHIICTMRSKTEYVLEADSNGKQVPRKVGMAPVQRQGMEYEFDLYLSIDWSHIATVTKSRCSAVDGQIVAKPGFDFLRPVNEWLTTGTVATDEPTASASVTDEQMNEIIRLCGKLATKLETVEKEFPKTFGVTRLAHLDVAQAHELIRRLTGRLAEKEAKAKPAATSAPQSTPAASEPVTPTARTAEGSHPTPAQPTNGEPMVTRDQLLSMKNYKDLLLITDEQWKKAMSTRGVASAKELTEKQANEVLGKLEEKHKEKAAANRNDELGRWADGATVPAGKS